MFKKDLFRLKTDHIQRSKVRSKNTIEVFTQKYLIKREADIQLTDLMFSDPYCSLEVDSFGQFQSKAKTHHCSEDTKDPAWEEEFEIEVDGAQTLRILVG